jgi:pilus assembly protein CpaB
MNKNRIWIGMAVALLIGFLASRFVYREITVAATVKTVSTSRVVIATAPLQLGTRLQASQLTTVEWPTSAPLSGSFTRVEDCVGRALLTDVVPNEPILDQKLAPREAGAGLPAVIPEGMRALSVRVDDVVGVAGFVVPGTMVDVLATGDPGTGAGDVVTRTILEDVRVLAAGQQITQDKEGKPQTVAVVTLLVNPDQADRLTLASNEGRLRLALRNTIDTKQLQPSPVFRSTVFYGQPPAKPKAVVAVKRIAPLKPVVVAPYTVEVIKGDKAETQTVTLK